MTLCRQLIILIAISLSLSACFDKDKSKPVHEKASQIITVKKQTQTHTLYFSGNLEPHEHKNVTAPYDGVISSQSFAFGQSILQGQLLFTMVSDKAEEAFQTDLTAYLKAKEQLNSSLGKYQSTSMLYKKGLASRDDNDSAESAYYLDRLALLQAESKLRKTLSGYQSTQRFFALSIADTKAIGKALLEGKKDDQITLKSPADGVALFPVSSDSASGGSSGSTEQKVQVGAQVKRGQVLVTIGLLKGMAMKAQVNEVNINEVRVGLKANITSDAFPGITLKGYIKSIAAQATDNNSIPVFHLMIVIPNITHAQAKVIRVGMSAKAAVTVIKSSQIEVPITAVFQQNGKSMVMRVNGHKQVATPVMTGKTSQSDVVILSGLNPGDRIVSRH
jgi:HlyD family secretion protein